MNAVRLIAPHETELRSIPQPEPGPGEVLVRVGAPGVCHSDLHIIDAPDKLEMPVPLTLGHANAGWIDALGGGVTGFDRGAAVAIVGLGGGALPVRVETTAMETRVSVPFWGTRAELAEVIALAQAGRIRAHVERFSLTDVQQAYDRLRAGQLHGRAVVIPSGGAA
jgi:D-arabinose 1-dehydrogenase-like Zn-dependent alcohol dehydrogenase